MGRCRISAGELKVIAYKNGVKWAEDVMKTTDKASALNISADRPAVKATVMTLFILQSELKTKTNS